MGMDGLEIVLLAEERFGIVIDDEEAEKVRTPGMLIDLVLTKLKAASTTACQSQRSFYLLRRAVTRLTGAKRREIAPETAVRGLVGEDHETEFWGKLRTEVLARSWPALGLAPRVEFARNGAVMVIWLSSSALLLMAAGIAGGILGGLLIAALGALIVHRLCQPFEKFIPSRVQTLRDLVAFVSTSDELQWSRRDVAKSVHDIVEEVLNPGDKYREDADFVKDLGLG